MSPRASRLAALVAALGFGGTAVGTGCGSGSGGPAGGPDAAVADGQAADARFDQAAPEEDAATDAISRADAPPDALPDVLTAPSCDAGIANDAGSVLCPGGVTYVSTTGDDAWDGCSPCFPKKTIAAAIGQVATAVKTPADGGAGTPVTEIHVCKGSYAESGLTLSVPVSLLGGYDCTYWTRTATYGYPTFDGTNATTVTNANAAAQSATFIVSAAKAAIGHGVTIDGFTFQGLPGTPQASYAVSVTDGAAPLLSNDQIDGAVGAMVTLAAAPATAGLAVAGASPEVKACSLTGGAGQSSGTDGSAGVLIQGASAPYVHGNTIAGGSGTPASDGLLVSGATLPLTSATGSAIEGNTVSAGTSATNAYGIRTTGGSANVDVVGNVVTATGAESGTIAGIDLESLVTSVVAQNRVAVGTLGASTGFTYGVLGDNGASTIEDNMIWAAPTANFSAGVEIRTQSPVIVSNTIYGGSNGSANEAVGAQLRIVSSTPPQGNDATVVDNLLIGGGSTVATAAIGTNACQTWMEATNGQIPVIAFLENNVMMNDAIGLLAYDQLVPEGIAFLECGSTATSATPEQAESFVRANAASSASANLTVATTCADAGDPQCVYLAGCDGTTANTPTCLANLFGAWSAKDAGSTALLTTGWRLVAGGPCAVSKGGLSSLGLPYDLFGQPRTPPVSIGADEFDGKCN